MGRDNWTEEPNTPIQRTVKTPAVTERQELIQDTSSLSLKMMMIFLQKKEILTSGHILT